MFYKLASMFIRPVIAVLYFFSPNLVMGIGICAMSYFFSSVDLNSDGTTVSSISFTGDEDDEDYDEDDEDEEDEDEYEEDEDEYEEDDEDEEDED